MGDRNFEKVKAAYEFNLLLNSLFIYFGTNTNKTYLHTSIR